VNHTTLLEYSVTISFIWAFSFAAVIIDKMAKKKNSLAKNQPGTMLEQKTFQDFNNRKPSLSDPNESKSKLSPENLNPADQAIDPLSDEMKEEMKPVQRALRKRTK
jgi:hypothetical protein